MTGWRLGIFSQHTPSSLFNRATRTEFQLDEIIIRLCFMAGHDQTSLTNLASLLRTDPY
jgi:hypothetical protein